MPPLLLRCYNVAAAVKTPANTGRERLGRNLGRHRKLGDCWHAVSGSRGMPARRAGPRLATSRCRSSTHVRSSATRALRASISCAVVLSWVACWPTNAPCPADPIPLNPSLVRLFCQGRRGRIQMRVQWRIYWTANEQDRWRVLPRAVRVEQNPLPRRWIDRHGRTSRNSDRSNEAGEAAR